jgi:mono/diheme cytochrome c family protein
MGTMNPDYTGTLERDPVTREFKLYDMSKPASEQKKIILATQDAGTPDSSCFFCHQGKQDKYQRDAMSTAGINCIDCHGDMLVQAGASAMVGRSSGNSSNPNSPEDPLVNTYYRLPWMQQPSCASCHTGMGDEPVRRRAYDMTTTEFRPLAAATERFAENMVPQLAFADEANSPTGYYGLYPSKVAAGTGKRCGPGVFSDTVTTDGDYADCVRGLFRESLDRHGKLPCASCHGPTHGIWPNPNPYANDNVTALQLQGHTGTLLECEVCHQVGGSKDVYFVEGTDEQTLRDLLVKGPHDMHPVADPRFILNDKADETPAHRLSHGDLAKHYNGLKRNWNGENEDPDLCGACHGADHKGNRLAKTPVDRVLSVSNPDRTDMSRDIKAKKQVKVKKGDIIGCDLCHRLETSFTLP